MTELLHESEFLRVWIEQDKKILKNQWTAKTSKMSQADFKREALTFAQFTQKYEVQFLLVDTLDYSYTLTPETQEWHDSVIIPYYLEIGIKKLALVVSSDLLTQFSIEQMFEERKLAEFAFETQYFNNLENARKWVES